MAEIARAHRDAAGELNVDVAPVGLAWLRAMKERPDLDLFVADREHPSLYGTYLATNVVYATVFDKSPINLTYVPAGMSPIISIGRSRSPTSSVLPTGGVALYDNRSIHSSGNSALVKSRAVERPTNILTNCDF